MQKALRTRLRRGVAVLLVVWLVPGAGAPAAASSGGRPGTLDPTFGTGGMVTTDFDGLHDSAVALVIQADGKLVAAGLRSVLTDFGTVTYDMALARYDHRGDLDTTFGTGGRVTTDVNGSRDDASALVVQPDGKLVAAGTTSDYRGDLHFLVARYLPDGSLDPDFGQEGLVVSTFGGRLDPESATALVVQPDGKLVAAGWADVYAGGALRFALIRYLPDGTPDPGFGTGGLVTTAIPGGRIVDLVVQPDGRLVALGTSSTGTTLARYLPDGSLDPTFGTGGVAEPDLGEAVYMEGMALQADGKLVTTGSAPGDGDDGYDVVLARFLPDGSLDPGFGPGGLVTTDFGGDDRAYDLVVQRDGKIMTAGSSRSELMVARYRRDGRVDRRFGDRGIAVADFPGGFSGAQALALQRDGKPVAAGVGYPDESPTGDADFALARFRGDPRRHP